MPIKCIHFMWNSNRCCTDKWNSLLSIRIYIFHVIVWIYNDVGRRGIRQKIPKRIVLMNSYWNCHTLISVLFNKCNLWSGLWCILGHKISHQIDNIWLCYAALIWFPVPQFELCDQSSLLFELRVYLFIPALNKTLSFDFYTIKSSSNGQLKRSLNL